VTFVRRLARDLAGHRKPPLTLLRRGLALARKEPALLRRWAELGTRPVRKADVEAVVAAHLAAAGRPLDVDG
jgi:uridine kinase